jgi:hypothetical protein
MTPVTTHFAQSHFERPAGAAAASLGVLSGRRRRNH